MIPTTAMTRLSAPDPFARSGPSDPRSPLAACTRPFDAAAARHLLRRSSFGAPPAEVDAAVARGLEASVLRLFPRVGAGDGSSGGDEFTALERVVDQGEIDGVQALWVARMLKSETPEVEKLALFWHGHFATSNDKVADPALMQAQIGLFRRQGAGSFEALLLEVSRDPAMLLWLDAEKNRRDKPNENFARELLELFTLGIGSYGERDVKEAARAFTGFRRAGQRFEFVPALHDDGVKEVLGSRGRSTADDVVALTARHPATARHLASKLLRFYVHPAPAENDVLAFAALLTDRELRIGESLRVLFASELFHRDENRAARIASPVEFVVAPLRTLGARAAPAKAAAAIGSLGQNLLRPPTVKGWDGETAWIHTATQLKRVNVAQRLARGELGAPYADEPPPFLAGTEAGTSERDVAVAAQVLLAARLSPDTTAHVAAAVASRDTDDRPDALLAALLCLPEGSLT